MESVRKQRFLGEKRYPRYAERKRELIVQVRYVAHLRGARRSEFESARGRALGSVGRARFSQPLLLSPLSLSSFNLRSPRFSFSRILSLLPSVYIYICMYTYVCTCVYTCTLSLSISLPRCFRRGVAGKGVSIICKRIRNA